VLDLTVEDPLNGLGCHEQSWSARLGSASPLAPRPACWAMPRGGRRL